MDYFVCCNLESVFFPVKNFKAHDTISKNRLSLTFVIGTVDGLLIVVFKT